LIFFISGLIIICLVFYDVYHGVVSPRPAARAMRIAPLLIGRVAWLPYRNMALKIKNLETREDILGNFAAIMFLCLMLTWLSLLILGYGMIFWSLRENIHPTFQYFSEAMYFAGTCILTIGFGDVVAVSSAARITALFAGASGLALLGLGFSAVFNLQNFLYAREVPLAVMHSRVQGNVSGLELLIEHSRYKTIDYLRSDIRDWEKWLGYVMETHRDFPLMAYFRSTGRGESWITCLGSMLDMCNVLTTTVSEHDFGECVFFHRLGASAAQLLCFYLGLPIQPSELMSEEQFTLGYDRLLAAGFVLNDKDTAWRVFAGRRLQYAAYISALCKYYAAKEPRWV
jgi:hypothetical protein